MRRLAVLMASGILLSGCTGGPADGTATGAGSTRSEPAQIPAATAGGACQLLDYADLERVLGLKFAVAGAAERDNTSTCVVRPRDTPLPELSLSVTPTVADASVFKDKVPPPGAKAVTGLGKAAFGASAAAANGHGPSVEVGWLTGDSRLMLLKLTLPDGDPQTAAADLTPKVIDLARLLDKAGV